MAAGTSTYDGLAVPLNGESEIEQVTAANDVLTLTQHRQKHYRLLQSS